MDVDFEQDGIQAGFLRVPHPTDSSAYGWQGVPVLCFKGGDGPTVTLMAGVHGDEFEGQLVLTELAEALKEHKFEGRVVVLPKVNIIACQAQKRFSPPDKMNLNRAFPGNLAGTYTEALASVIETRVLSITDFLIDLHSGGASLEYSPSVILYEEQFGDTGIKELIHCCDLEFAQVFQIPIHKSSILAAAARNSVRPITMELGGGSVVRDKSIACGLASIKNILRFLGIVPTFGDISTHSSRNRVLFVDRSTDFVHSDCDGIIVWEKSLGVEVSAGDRLGYVAEFNGGIWRKSPIRSIRDGFLVCRRALPNAEVGDCLFHTAYEKDAGAK